MTEQFYSDDGVDAWIAANLQLPEIGFYVDCGCAHPMRYSNTAFLRARGWDGLAIDGTPEYAPEWDGVAGAKFVHAVVSAESPVRFLNERTNALVSRIHEQGEEVPAHKLETLVALHAPNRSVDFLAIDIEGHENDVVESFLWQYEPEIIVAEYNSCHRGIDVRLFNELLTNCNYRLRHMTPSNAVFVL